MSGIFGVSAYQQAGSAMNAGSGRTVSGATARNTGTGRTGSMAAGADRGRFVREDPGVETKGWSPIDEKSSLVPVTTEYGNTIGEVRLSEKAADYYEKLKSKFHNMEFIAVSKDMKSQVAQNAAAYGNSAKMVVLIDEEKLERMAEDESFRKKYEGIIAMSQMKLTEAKNSLASTGASLKNFGMSVDSDGKESFFATVEKSLDAQKKRMEKKAAEKKEQKIKEKKKADKEKREEKIKESRGKEKAKGTEKTEGTQKAKGTEKTEGTEEAREPEEKEYVIFEAKSMDELISKVRDHSYESASSRVMTEAEMALGASVDFRG